MCLLLETKSVISTMAKIRLFNILFNRIDGKLQKKHIRLRKTFRDSTVFFLWWQRVYKKSQSLTKTGSFGFSLLNAGVEQEKNDDSLEINYILRRKIKEIFYLKCFGLPHCFTLFFCCPECYEKEAYCSEVRLPCKHHLWRQR